MMGSKNVEDLEKELKEAKFKLDDIGGMQKREGIDGNPSLSTDEYLAREFRHALQEVRKLEKKIEVSRGLINENEIYKNNDENIESLVKIS